MPRKYDCLVRFYASWFADLTNESKGFSFDEIGQIVLKIAEAEIKGNAEIIQDLPVTIKRGLQMATLEEQITRLIERSQRCKDRGAIGGQVTAQKNAMQSQSERVERERRLGIERELENERRRKEDKKREYDIALFRKVCELAGVEVSEAHKHTINTNIYRKVWAEDIMKGNLGLPEWLIYHRLMTPDKVKTLYRNFLESSSKGKAETERSSSDVAV